MEGRAVWYVEIEVVEGLDAIADVERRARGLSSLRVVAADNVAVLALVVNAAGCSCPLLGFRAVAGLVGVRILSLGAVEGLRAGN